MRHEGFGFARSASAVPKACHPEGAKTKKVVIISAEKTPRLVEARRAGQNLAGGDSHRNTPPLRMRPGGAEEALWLRPPIGVLIRRPSGAKRAGNAVRWLSPPAKFAAALRASRNAYHKHLTKHVISSARREHKRPSGVERISNISLSSPVLRKGVAGPASVALH